MMLELAHDYPEYRDDARSRCKLVETTAADYYGKGYQDVQNRVPKINNTMRRPRLEAARHDGRRAAQDLRRVSRPGRRRPQAGRAIVTALARWLASSLKIDVDTLRGTREGVPSLVAPARQARRRRDVPVQPRPRPHRPRDQARVPARLLRARCRARRWSSTTACKTLLYGTLLPGPDIGRRAGDVMRAVRDAGFEIGIHTLGSRPLAGRRAPAPTRAWTRARDAARLRALHRDLRHAAAHARRGRLADERARASADAARWASTTAPTVAARTPYLPVLRRPELIRCPQLPTTLPTLDELIGIDGVDREQRRRASARSTRANNPHDQVFTLHAELEGQKLAPVFEQLLAGWHAQGLQLRHDGRLSCDAGPLDPAHVPCDVGRDPGARGRTARAAGLKFRPTRRSSRTLATESRNRRTTGENFVPIAVDQPVPDFTAPSTAGDFTLSSLRGKTVVLYFYPKDNTPGCTTEGLQFRDLYAQFQAAGAEVVGISRDSLKSHENFKAKMEFPFDAGVGRRRKALRPLRCHQDEEHVWQGSARNRAHDLPDRCQRNAPARVSRREGAGARRSHCGRCTSGLRPVILVRNERLSTPFLLP